MSDEEQDDWGSDRIGWWVVIAITLALLIAVLVLALHEDSAGVVGAVAGG